MVRNDSEKVYKKGMKGKLLPKEKTKIKWEELIDGKSCQNIKLVITTVRAS